MSDSRIITLNVGGKRFQTRLLTLMQYPDTRLARDFKKEDYAKRAQPDGSFFYDRNGEKFGAILDYYRTGYLPTDECEAEYWQVPWSEHGGYQRFHSTVALLRQGRFRAEVYHRDTAERILKDMLDSKIALEKLRQFASPRVEAVKIPLFGWIPCPEEVEHMVRHETPVRLAKITYLSFLCKITQGKSTTATAALQPAATPTGAAAAALAFHNIRQQLLESEVLRDCFAKAGKRLGLYCRVELETEGHWNEQNAPPSREIMYLPGYMRELDYLPEEERPRMMCCYTDMMFDAGLEKCQENCMDHPLGKAERAPHLVLYVHV